MPMWATVTGLTLLGIATLSLITIQMQLSQLSRRIEMLVFYAESTNEAIRWRNACQ